MHIPMSKRKQKLTNRLYTRSIVLSVITSAIMGILFPLPMLWLKIVSGILSSVILFESFSSIALAKHYEEGPNQ